MVPSSFSRVALLLLGSFAVFHQRYVVASSPSVCTPPRAEVDGVFGGDEMALLHGTGSHPHTATIRKRMGHAEDLDVVILQTAARVDKSDSPSRSGTEATSNDTTASSASPSQPAASTVSLVLEADATITGLASDATAAAAEAVDAEGFTSWLSAEKSVESAEMTELASTEITAVEAKLPTRVARETPRVRHLSDVVAADIAAAQARAEAATVKPVLLALSSFSARTKGSLESMSYELGLHLPVTLALLAFIATIAMMTLSTLKSWANMFFDAPPEGPQPLERPNPLQALRVLQLNLDNIGQAKGMNAKPTVHIDAGKTPSSHDSS